MCSKNSTACSREARFGDSRGYTWNFGGLKNDVKWGQNSDGISGPKLGGDLGPTVGAGADPSHFRYEKSPEVSVPMRGWRPRRGRVRTNRKKRT